MPVYLPPEIIYHVFECVKKQDDYKSLCQINKDWNSTGILFINNFRKCRCTCEPFSQDDKDMNVMLDLFYKISKSNTKTYHDEQIEKKHNICLK